MKRHDAKLKATKKDGEGWRAEAEKEKRKKRYRESAKGSGPTKRVKKG